MGIPLADDRRIDIDDMLLKFHPFDRHCDAVGNFLFQTAQRLFPDHLCNDLTLRLVCDRIFIVEGFSIGKIFENAVQQRIGIVAAKCRYRDDFCKIHLFPVGFHRIQNGCFRNGVDLVDHEDDRQPAAF